LIEGVGGEEREKGGMGMGMGNGVGLVMGLCFTHGVEAIGFRVDKQGSGEVTLQGIRASREK